MGGRELDADSAARGRRPLQVVGVTPPGFHGLSVGIASMALPLCRRAQDRNDVVRSPGDGPAARWRVRRARDRRAARAQPGAHEGHADQRVHRGHPRALPALRARGRAGAERLERAAPRLRHVAVAAARDHRPGAADRLRQHRQPDAGPRRPASARSRSAWRSGRRAGGWSRSS